MISHGPWKIKHSNDVYEDPFINVRLDAVVRPDGKDGQHVVVEMKPGVCVLPIDEDENVYLTREFHYGVGRYSIEAVSGGIEPGEDPDLTAKRELQEEIGLAAAHWEHVGTVDPFTTIVVSPTRLYIVRGLTETPKNPEGTEIIETVKMPLAQAIEMIERGEITHAPTCVVLLQAARRSHTKTK
ncbi:MAG: NUDIX hydrolase [Mariniblastus sp.]|nr:NUDIX hydrolase [Mariniblastus sp.]